jgi:hypothetical protein
MAIEASVSIGNGDEAVVQIESERHALESIDRRFGQLRLATVNGLWPPPGSNDNPTVFRMAEDPTGVVEAATALIALARTNSVSGSIVVEVTGGALEALLGGPADSVAKVGRADRQTPADPGACQLRDAIKVAFDPNQLLRANDNPGHFYGFWS